jgi:hypothetical protein
MKEIKFGVNDIMIPIKDQTKAIYSIVIMRCLHSIGINMIKRSSLIKIMDHINSMNRKNMISLDGGRMATISNNNLIIIINQIHKSIN